MYQKEMWMGHIAQGIDANYLAMESYGEINLSHAMSFQWRRAESPPVGF